MGIISFVNMEVEIGKTKNIVEVVIFLLDYFNRIVGAIA